MRPVLVTDRAAAIGIPTCCSLPQRPLLRTEKLIAALWVAETHRNEWIAVEMMGSETALRARCSIGSELESSAACQFGSSGTRLQTVGFIMCKTGSSGRVARTC